MKTKAIILFSIVLVIVALNTLTKQEIFYHPEFREAHLSSSFGISSAYAYPPAVGILSNSKNCISCHTNNGQWQDDSKTIIDILDKDTKKSFKQSDGTFLIETKRGEQKTVLTVIGRKKTSPFLHLIAMLGSILTRQPLEQIRFQNLLQIGM